MSKREREADPLEQQGQQEQEQDDQQQQSQQEQQQTATDEDGQLSEQPSTNEQDQSAPGQDDEAQSNRDRRSSDADAGGGIEESDEGDRQARKKQRTEEGALPTGDKQANNGGNNPTSSSSPAPDEARLLIDSSHVGALIGKGGSNITRLRTTSGAQATFLKNDSFPHAPERVLQLRGSMEAVQKAARMVLEIMAEEIGNKAAGGGAGAAAGGEGINHKDAQLHLLVHKGAVGAIIGEKGSHIKKSSQETGARIHVGSDVLGFSTDKLVSLTGTVSQVHGAFVRVVEQVQGNPLKPGTKVTNYVPGSSAPALAGAGGGVAGGAVPGAPAGLVAPGPYGVPPGGRPGAMHHAPPPGYPPHAGMYGYGAPPPHSAYPPYGAPPQPYGYPPHPADPYAAAAGVAGGAVPPYGGQAPRPPRDRMSDPNCATQRIAIPSVCSGVVLGHGGSIVRELVKKSGAKISLAPPDAATPTERVVSITGLPDQIQAAIYLIQKQVESYTPGRPAPAQMA